MFRIDGAATAAGLRALDPQIQAVARQTLGQTSAYAAELARKTSSFTDRSGKLRKSIVRGQRSVWSHFVQAGGRPAQCGLFVEDGTRPHVIEAKNARALRFVWRGALCFYRRVHHPGTAPRHFMLDARNVSEGVLEHFITNGLTAVLH